MYEGRGIDSLFPILSIIWLTVGRGGLANIALHTGRVAQLVGRIWFRSSNIQQGAIAMVGALSMLPKGV